MNNTRRLTRLLALMLTTAIAASVAAPRAQACSASPCLNGRFIPEADTLPSNLPAFYWVPPMLGSGTLRDATRVTLRELKTDRLIELSARALGGHFLLAPRTPLEPLAEYRLTDSTAEPCSPFRSEPTGTPARTFRATAAQPLPRSLGTLIAVPRGIGLLALSASASCDVCVEAERVTVTLDPAPEAEPWLAALHFSTWVDGREWTADKDGRPSTYDAGSWFGRGRDVLYRECRSWRQTWTSGLSTGEHSVVMKATLPGTDVALETAPVTVRFACAFATTDDSFPCHSDGGVPDPWLAEASAPLPVPLPNAGCSTIPRGAGAFGWLCLGGAVISFATARRRRPAA